MSFIDRLEKNFCKVVFLEIENLLTQANITYDQLITIAGVRKNIATCLKKAEPINFSDAKKLFQAIYQKLPANTALKLEDIIAEQEISASDNTLYIFPELKELRLEAGFSSRPKLSITSGIKEKIITRLEQGKPVAYSDAEKLFDTIYQILPALKLEDYVIEWKAPVKVSLTVINCKQEIEAFEKVIKKNAEDRKIIFLQGESGSGKTTLLSLYHKMAKEQYRAKSIMVNVIPAAEIFVYLKLICNKIDENRAAFPNFYEQLNKQPVKFANEIEQLESAVNLTTYLFKDLNILSQEKHLKPTIILFDIEAISQNTEHWLINYFLPNADAVKEIIVVIAAKRLPFNIVNPYYHFQLKGVSLDDLILFLVNNQISFDQKEIEKLFKQLSNDEGYVLPALLVPALRSQLNIHVGLR